MGIKTELSLSHAQNLFPHKKILKLIPTSWGVIDTTYIAQTAEKRYILKRYERAYDQQIADEKVLLSYLSHLSFLVPKPLEECDTWHLFSYITGESPLKIDLFHIRSIGSFLGRLHTATRKKRSSFTPFKACELKQSVQKVQKSHPRLAKTLSPLKNFPDHHNGIIHGDLFPDNAKFDGSQLGVFDFIEAGNGSFCFDLAVVAISWVAQKRLSLLQLKGLLQSYNQHSCQKITFPELLNMMEYAALAYAMKRFVNKQSSLSYQKMLRTHKKLKQFKKRFLSKKA